MSYLALNFRTGQWSHSPYNWTYIASLLPVLTSVGGHFTGHFCHASHGLLSAECSPEVSLHPARWIWVSDVTPRKGSSFKVHLIVSPDVMTVNLEFISVGVVSVLRSGFWALALCGPSPLTRASCGCSPAMLLLLSHLSIFSQAVFRLSMMSLCSEVSSLPYYTFKTRVK